MHILPAHASMEKESEDNFVLRPDRCLFRIVAANPSVQKVAPQSLKISEADAIAVQMVVIKKVDRVRKKIWVNTESFDGSACMDFHIFTGSSLTVDDLTPMRVWNTSSVLTYSFDGIQEVDSRLEVAWGEVCAGLAPSLDDSGPPYVLDEENENKDAQAEVLKLLEQHGRIRCLHAGSSAWTMTELGKNTIGVSAMLTNHRHAFKPRDVPVADQTVFELMYNLDKQGWRCMEKQPQHRRQRRRRRQQGDSGGVVVPEDYSPDQPKIWWLKPGQATVFRSYLQCLLLADTLTAPVRHFQQEGWYSALLQGKPFVRRQRGGGTKFAFALPGEDLVVTESKKTSRAPRRTRTSAAAGSSSDGPESPASCEGEGDQEDRQGRDSSDSGSRDSCDSSSGGSSSASGSGSTSRAGASTGKEDTGDEADTSGDRDGAQHAAASEGDRGDRGGCRSTSGSAPIDSTIYWRGFKLCLVKRLGVTLGYEMQCYIDDHKGCRCTRSRSFAAHGGPQRVERLLKQWALAGHTEQCDSWLAHSSYPDPKDSELLSREQLDAQQFVPKRTSGGHRKRTLP